MDINQINERYGLSGNVRFTEGKGGFTFADVKNEHATAKISLYGGQILSFVPNGHTDLLMVSDSSFYETGRAIRGGVPICWPWFGPHATDSSLPQHGFMRLSNWSLVGVAQLLNGETQIILGLSSSERTKPFWPYEFDAQITFTIGKKLSIDLKTSNVGDVPFVISEALHSYLAVEDVEKIKIEGLKDVVYSDATLAFKEFTQTDDVLTFAKEENRRYKNSKTTCKIKDASRTISVEKGGSDTTVVWNPWETAKKIADLGDEEYRRFVCVEAVNAFENSKTLEAGETHVLSTVISVE